MGTARMARFLTGLLIFGCHGCVSRETVEKRLEIRTADTAEMLKSTDRDGRGEFSRHFQDKIYRIGNCVRKVAYLIRFGRLTRIIPGEYLTGAVWGQDLPNTLYSVSR